MFPRQAFASMLHLFVVFTFFVVGFGFIALPYLPEMRVQVVDFFSHHFETCHVVGLSLLVAAFVLLAGFYALDRGKYLVIKMGAKADVSIVRAAVEECFTRAFSTEMKLGDVQVDRKSEIAIEVSIASLEEDQREELFLRAEQEIGTLLKERFGYRKPFLLIVKE